MQHLDGRIESCGYAGRCRGALEQLRPARRLGGDLYRLLEERDRLIARTESDGPLRGGTERDPRLGRKSICFRAVAGVLLSRQVVTGQGACQLVGPELLEERAAARWRDFRSFLDSVL